MFAEIVADAVREGRRREFRSFAGFAAGDIPDPNAVETFARSRVAQLGDDSFHRRLLDLRRTLIIPRLPGTRSLGAEVPGAKAVTARWRLGDGTTLTVAANFGTDSCPLTPPPDRPIFESRTRAIGDGRLRDRSTVAFLG